MIFRHALAAVAAVAVIATGSAPASAAADDAYRTTQKIKLQTREEADRPVPRPATAAGRALLSTAGNDCDAMTNQPTGSCVVIVPTPKGHKRSAKPANAPTAKDGEALAAAANTVPVPSWCYDNPDQGVFGLRDQACELNTAWIRTWVTNQSGTREWTGEVYMDLLNYEYTDRTQPTWGHQIEVGPYWGWGVALDATVEGSTTADGACTKVSSDFPAEAVSPLQTWHAGTSFYNTGATLPGDIGFCATTWTLTFRIPGHSPITLTVDRDNVRCDNATPGNLKVGCVIPWYPSPVYYSQAANPTLANHVAQAQASGLPGGTYDAPLRRATSQAVIDANRAAACGDAPSIQGLSCDEYPLASTYQGLSTGGGTRRTFDGCNFNLPRATGATGVSVCMINEADNNSQGGLQSALYRTERILDNDPYRVIVVA